MSSGCEGRFIGGTRAILGTNPIAIGIPTDAKPFVLDLATSIVSMGRIHRHALRGEPIPAGWAVDATGRPTTDPEAAKLGAIAPFGGAKGYGLGLTIELLVASLAGSEMAPEVRGTLDETDPATKGDLLILIDPAAGAANTAAPDFDALAAEFAARSRDIEARASIRTDVAHGTGPRETLDIVFPENSTADAPLHVFVHGGYWRSSEKRDYRFVAQPVLAVGGIAALVEYDLMPGHRLPTLVDQVRRAVLWLQNNARKFGADPERITVSGHSAGAHLSSYLAATGSQETSSPTLPDLKGLLLVSGIYDLSGIPDSFLRHEAEITRAEAADWSPLDARERTGPIRIIACGQDETAPFHEQARALHDKFSTNSQPSELLPIPARNHMNIVLDLADPDTTLGARLADLAACR